ncbi:type I restriction enzyme HsdR N-terminal domain-containing protein [Fibrobacter sp.]|uniref:type I restriction enzyme HsdR N-terminal domain-containing protein n=1 Tax=Fibrobacter sp. TaxID=35828 RepID=UPI00386D543C
MVDSDIWNEIVDLFHENQSKDERIIQNDWEKMVLRKYLGFDKSDIDSQRRLRIGSTDKKIDVMLKKNGEEFCVIELKQHSHSRNNGGQAQLFSYLNQLKKIRLGILVCDKLYVYAFDYKLDDCEQAFVEIPFEEDDKNGIAFVGFFQKQELDQDKIVDWVNEKHRERLEDERQREKEREIVEKIKSEITDDLIKNLLRHHFVNKFGCADSFFEQAYKEHIGMVPPPPNDFDFDDPPTPRQTTGLKVVLPKGQIIQEHKASETLCRAVRYTVDLYGSSKVLEVMRNNNIVCDKELLLKKGPHNHPKASSTPIGNGYYVNTHMNNDTKRDKLVRLGNALGLHWTVSVD